MSFFTDNWITTIRCIMCNELVEKEEVAQKEPFGCICKKCFMKDKEALATDYE